MHTNICTCFRQQFVSRHGQHGVCATSRTEHKLKCNLNAVIKLYEMEMQPSENAAAWCRGCPTGVCARARLQRSRGKDWRGGRWMLRKGLGAARRLDLLASLGAWLCLGHVDARNFN